MPDIPSNPNLIDNSRPKTQMTTETGSRVTPGVTSTQPFLGGQAAVNIIEDSAKMLNTVADEQAKKAAYDKGFEEQQQAGSKYVGSDMDANPFTLTGKARAQGRSVAFLNSKQSELTELKVLAQGNPNNLAAYQKKAEEFKGKWLRDIPSFMQSQMTSLFDEKNSVYGSQVAGNIAYEELQRDIGVVETQTSQEVNTLRAMLLDPSVSIEDKEKQFLLVRNKLSIDLPKVGAGESKISKVNDAVRLNLFQTLATAEYLNADPTRRAEIDAAIKAGKSPFGEYSQQFEKFFPKGLALTTLEQTKVAEAIAEAKKQVEAQYKTQLGVTDDAFKTATKDITNGKGFTREGITDTGADTYYKEVSKYDFNDFASQWRTMGKDESYIAQKKQEYELAIKVGSEKRLGYLTPLNGQESVNKYAQFEQEKVAIQQSTLSAGEKAILTQQVEARKTAFRQGQDDMADALQKKDGKNIADVLLKKGIIELKDLNKEGLDNLFYQIAITTNTPIRASAAVPDSIIASVKGQMQFTDAAQGKQIMDQLETQYGRDNAILIYQKLLIDSDKRDDDALLSISGIADVNNQQQAIAAKTNYKNNLPLVSQYYKLKDGKSLENAVIDDVDKQFSRGGSMDFAGNSYASESLKGLYTVVYTDYLTRVGDTDKAHKKTKEFIEKSFFIGNLDSGIKVIASKKEIPDTTTWQQYQKTWTAFMDDPLSFGVRSATNDNIVDVVAQLKNKSNYTVSIDGASMSVYDVNGRPMLYALIPGVTQGYYTEGTITPASQRKRPVQLETAPNNGSSLIKYNHKQFNEGWDPMTRPREEIGEFGPEMVSYRKNLYDKGQDAVNKFFTLGDKSKIEIRKGETEDEAFAFYNKQTGKKISLEEATKLDAEFAARNNAMKQDWGATDVGRKGTIDSAVMSVIGHAFTTNQVQPWHVEYIKDFIPYASGIKNVPTDQVLSELKKQHSVFMAGAPLSGDNGGLHTPTTFMMSVFKGLERAYKPQMDSNLYNTETTGP